MSEFTLNVRGQKYAGWTELQITRSIEELAHSFNVRLTDRWRPNAEKIPVKAGDDCTIAYDDGTVTTGYVDEDELSYGANSRTLGFVGRSKTGDLVDCGPARGARRAWRNTGLLAIANSLCDPFGITASAKVDLGAAIGRFAVEDGETIFDALERAAKSRGVLMLTDSDGNLVFDRAGTTKVQTVLELGVNIKRCSGKRSWRDRFSEYTVLCQSTGNDNLFGKATSLKKTSTDAAITRHRPTTIMADTEDSGSELQKRADWERNVRAGRSRTLTYAVVGWEHEGGLWAPNSLVQVRDQEQDIDDELLIASVTYSRGDQGTITTIDVTGKEAFDVQPLPPPKKKAGGFF